MLSLSEYAEFNNDLDTDIDSELDDIANDARRRLWNARRIISEVKNRVTDDLWEMIDGLLREKRVLKEELKDRNQEIKVLNERIADLSDSRDECMDQKYKSEIRLFDEEDKNRALVVENKILHRELWTLLSYVAEQGEGFPAMYIKQLSVEHRDKGYR